MPRTLHVFAAVFVLSAQMVFAELPAQMRKAIEQGAVELASVRTASKQHLLDRFDKKLELARASKKHSEEERKGLMGSIEAERSLFDQQGVIPFSPSMRQDLLDYFGKVRKAELSLAKEYDHGMEFYSRKSRNEEAQTLLKEKQKALLPQVVGVWELHLEGDPDHVFPRTLKSDGTTLNGAWTIGNDKMILRSPNPSAPGGVWVLTCTVAEDGRHLKATNQLGNQFEGKLQIENR